jgi:hypothetical protein
MLAGVLEDTVLTQRRQGVLFVFTTGACVEPGCLQLVTWLHKLLHHGKPRMIPMNPGLRPGRRGSFDPARVTRGEQVEARTCREVCRKTLPRWCRTTNLAPT